MSTELEPEVEYNRVGIAAYVRLVRENRNFRRLWLAQIVSEMGDWFYSLAIYNLLLEMTGRASSVALALMLQVLPQTLMGATAGVVNDRVRRKLVMITSDLARMTIVLCMLFVRSPGMVWLVYPLLLLETMMVAFFEPARTSVIPNICRPEDAIVANTLASSTWSVNLMLGASIGGLVAALLGRNAVFVLNGMSFLVSAWLIRGMKFNEPHAEAAEPLRWRHLVDVSPILEGVRYVRRDARLLAMVFVKSGLLMMGPSWVLFTVMGKRDFPVHWHNLSPERGAILGMSLLLGARGVGTLIGPLLTARWAGHDERRLRFSILGGFALAAVGYALLGRSATLLTASLSTALAHVGGSVIWVFSTTLLQLNTEDKFRGRVFAAELGCAMFVLAAGAWLAGAAMDAGMTPRMVATFTGLLMGGPAVAWLLAQRLWRVAPGGAAAETG